MSDNLLLKHKQQFFMSRESETGFGTGTGATITHALNPVSGLTGMRLQRNMKPNLDQSTGYEGATESYPLEYYMGPNPITFYSDARTDGLFRGHMMAIDTVTETSTDSGVFVHAHRIGSVPGTFPGSFICSTRIERAVPDSQFDKMYHGVYIESLVTTGGTTDFVTVTPTFSGCGKTATAHSGGADGLIGHAPEFAAHKTKISIQPIVTKGTSPYDGSFTPVTSPGVFANTLTGTGAIDLTAEGIESWTLTENLNIDQASKLRPGVTSGPGAYQGCPNVMRRTWELTVTGESTEAIQALTYLYENQTIADQAHYAVVIERVSDVEVVASSGVYWSEVNVMPIAQIMPVAYDDGERVKSTLTFQAMNPTGGTANRMFYSFTVDDEENSYGAEAE